MLKGISLVIVEGGLYISKPTRWEPEWVKRFLAGALMTTAQVFSRPGPTTRINFSNFSYGLRTSPVLSINGSVGDAHSNINPVCCRRKKNVVVFSSVC